MVSVLGRLSPLVKSIILSAGLSFSVDLMPRGEDKVPCPDSEPSVMTRDSSPPPRTSLIFSVVTSPVIGTFFVILLPSFSRMSYFM